MVNKNHANDEWLADEPTQAITQANLSTNRGANSDLVDYYDDGPLPAVRFRLSNLSSH